MNPGSAPGSSSSGVPPGAAGDRLEFGPFLLDERRGLLLREGAAQALTPRAYETLLHFLRNPGRLIAKEELFDAVWPGLHVEENNLSQQVSALRKALGEGWIETVPRRGYRFVGEVRRAASPAAPATSSSASSATAARTATDSRSYALPLGVAAVALLSVVVLALARREVAAPPQSIRTLAVLPFEPASVEKGLGESVGLGLADAIIDRLGSDGAVAVRPTSAIRGFDGAMDPLAAAQQLHVDAVLQSSFAWEGQQVRVRARLVDARVGGVVWAAPFVVNANDLSQLEDSISGAVASRLAADGGRAPVLARSPRRAIDSRAYVSFLQGRWHWSRRTMIEVRAAEADFRAALQREPAYAAAYAGLADSLLTQSRHAEARVAATHALALDATIAEPYATLGFLAWFQDHDAVAAQTELARAIEINPSYTTAYQWLAWVDVTHRRCPAALAMIERARSLDPISTTIAADVAHVHYYCGEMAAADREIKAALALDPHFAQAHSVLGQVLIEEGRFAEALGAFDAASQDGAGDVRAGRLMLHVREGDVAAAEEDIAVLRGYHDNHYALACGLARLGRIDEAVAALDRAVSAGESNVMLLAVDPNAGPLRADARVQRQMVQLGLVPAG